MSDDGARIPVDHLLRALRPVRSDDYLRPGEDPAADALLARITATAPRRRRRRWSRTTFFVTGACILVGAGVTTAVLRSRSADDPTVVDCYSSASPDIWHIEVLPVDTERTPIEQCQVLWTDGTFASQIAPQLVACVTDQGLTAVLPGDESACSTLEWELADLSEATQANPATGLDARLSDRFVERCLDADAATRVVNEVFDELGLGAEWSIDATRATPSECNAYALLAADKTVVIAELRQ